MLKRHTLFIITALLMGFLACTEEDLISRRYPCRFYFYQEPHPTSLIFAAYRSPGAYVYVYSQIDNTGRRHVYVQSNDGKTPLEDNVISTDLELKAPYVLGANNEMGLIVGCTNFNGPAAYDRTCPNCATRQPLSWATNRQQVRCNKCLRTYSLDTGGIVEGDDGDALMRYNISFDGSRLYVGN